MQTRTCRSWLFLIIVGFLLLLPTPALAQGPVNLDPSFDGDGKVTTNFFNTNSSNGYAVALQPDGKILVAGSGNNGSNIDFALARYNPNGSLDPTFDGDGWLMTDFSGSDDVAYALILQPDGKIVAAGSSGNFASEDFALARYNADGSLDTTFDGDGKVVTFFNDYGDIAYAVALQADGKIVVAGFSNNKFALARYNSGGSLDSTFDDDGKVLTDISEYDDWARAIAVQPDGKIVVAGYGGDNNGYGFALARYNPNGSLDTSFNGDGQVSTDFGRFDYARALALQPDGKILAAGYTNISDDNYEDFALARYNPDGSLDPTFDLAGEADGKVITDFSGANDFAYALALQPNGKILVAGFTENTSFSDINFGLARYNSDGSLDPTFDGDGRTSTAFSSGLREAAHALALQPDGKIIAAGEAISSSPLKGNFALARYNPSGSLDPGFDGDGKVTTSIGQSADVASAVAVQPDGKIVVAGFSNNNNDFALARYNPNGSLDLSFDGDGKVTTGFDNSYDYATALALQPDGKIVVAGYSIHEGNYRFALARYNPDGSLDLTFGGDGKVTTDIRGGSKDVAYALALQPDGKIVVAGEMITTSPNEADFALVRYNPNGSLDPSFGVNGRVSTDSAGSLDDVAYAVGIQPNGKIVVTGHSGEDLALLRYLPNGALDPGFDKDGRLTTDFNQSVDTARAMIIQRDRKILVAGRSLGNFALARYNPDGSLDLTFGGDGKVTTDIGNSDDIITALSLQIDYKILAAGYSDQNFILARYNPDGSLDPTFDGDGKVITNLGSGYGRPFALARQPDSNLVVAGVTHNPGADFLVARYLTPIPVLGAEKVYLPQFFIE